MENKKYCDNPNCNIQLGELACGNDFDNGMYCSTKCSELGKTGVNVKALQEEIIYLKSEVEKYKRYWKEADERNAQYVEYKNAFKCLLKELGIKNKS